MQYVRLTDCPKSAKICILHNIAHMPDNTKKTAVVHINVTRSAENEKNWLSDEDCFFCNLHYEGPSSVIMIP